MVKGYWKLNDDSDEIFKCDFPDLCVGGSDLQRFCTEGHLGALCGACDIENKLGK